MTGLCSYEDILDRVADVGFATASDDELVNKEYIGKVITQIDADLTLELTKKVAKVIAPFPVDFYNHTPAQLVELITDEGKAFLNNCAITWVKRRMFQDGTERLRGPGNWDKGASDDLNNALKQLNLSCQEEFDSVCPLLTFNQDGITTVTLMERLLMQQRSSVRVTV